MKYTGQYEYCKVFFIDNAVCVAVAYLYAQQEGHMPAPAGKTDVPVRMDDELKEKLKELARVEHRSLSNLVTHAAQVYLDKFAGTIEAAGT